MSTSSDLEHDLPVGDDSPVDVERQEKEVCRIRPSFIFRALGLVVTVALFVLLAFGARSFHRWHVENSMHQRSIQRNLEDAEAKVAFGFRAIAFYPLYIAWRRWAPLDFDEYKFAGHLRWLIKSHQEARLYELRQWLDALFYRCGYEGPDPESETPDLFEWASNFVRFLYAPEVYPELTRYNLAEHARGEFTFEDDTSAAIFPKYLERLEAAIYRTKTDRYLPGFGSMHGLEKLSLFVEPSWQENVTPRTVDLSWLHELTNLKILELYCYYRVDLGQLVSLIALEDLTIGLGKDQDHDGISKLTRLRKIKIARGQSRLDFLAPLVNLESITVNWDVGSITDLAPLASLTRLKSLRLPGNKIHSLASLAGLHDLEIVDLSWNSIEDATPLAGLEKLKDLELGHNPIRVVPNLTTLPQLRRISISSGRIGDLRFLEGAKSLEELCVIGGNIRDLSPLRDLSKLECVFAQSNRISDPSPLARLPSLHWIKLGSNEIESLRGLAGSNARILDLSGNRITNFDGLDALGGRGLTLDLSNNRIVDLTPLIGNTTIWELSIAANRIERLDGIDGMKQLSRLDVSNNRIVDLRPISRIEKLEWLDIRGNPIVDYTPLLSMKNLKIVEVSEKNAEIVCKALGPSCRFHVR